MRDILNEILNEMKESRVTIIRLNPDFCPGIKANLKSRVSTLISLLDSLSVKIWSDQDSITVYYLYYDTESEAVTNTFKKCFVNS